MGKNANNPDRMLMCKGNKCVQESRKHPAKHLLSFSGTDKQYYCKECFDSIKEERRQRAMLEDYIKKLYGINNIGGLIRAQIKRFQNDHGYTLKNIRLSLHYFFEIRGKNAKDSKGIGIVPFVHDDMIAYYKARAARRETTVVKNVTTKKVKTNYATKKNKNYKQDKMINLEELTNAIKE